MSFTFGEKNDSSSVKAINSYKFIRLRRKAKAKYIVSGKNLVVSYSKFKEF